MIKHFLKGFVLAVAICTNSFALHPNANDPIAHCSHMTLEKCERIQKKPSTCFDKESMQYVIQKRNAVPVCDDNYLLHLCYCSCFHPDTKILASVDQGKSLDWHVISELSTLRERPYVAVLEEGSTMKTLKLGTSQVEEWIKSDTPHEMIEIKTTYGRQITLTGLHALLIPSGALKLAQDIKVGDELVGYDGRIESVISTETVLSEKGILNLLTSGDTNHRHLIAANELLVGDLAWENWLLGQIAEVQIRLE